MLWNQAICVLSVLELGLLRLLELDVRELGQELFELNGLMLIRLKLIGLELESLALLELDGLRLLGG